MIWGTHSPVHILTMNIKIQTIVDGLLSKANKLNVDLLIEQAFDDKYRQGESVIVQNTETMKFGVISCNVAEYPDDDVVFLEFNDKLYTYAKMEGFERDNMLDVFDNKVLKKLTRREFTKFIFQDVD